MTGTPTPALNGPQRAVAVRHRSCVRVLELAYDHLNEILGRLDVPGPVRIDVYKLRGVVERQLLIEGVML